MSFSEKVIFSNNSSHKSKASVAAGLLAGLFASTLLHAADLIWDGDTDSNLWDTSDGSTGGGTETNWNPDVVADADDDVTFGSASSDTTIDLNGNREVVSVTFNRGSGYTLGTIIGGETLTLGSGDLIVENGHHFINSHLQLNGAGHFNIDSGDQLTIHGITSGNQSLSINAFLPGTPVSGGRLNLTGANTYTGTTTVQNGDLWLSGGNNRLPGSTGLIMRFGAALHLNGNIEQTFGSFDTQSGTDIELLSGAQLKIGNGNQDGFSASIISGDGSLEKLGAGTMELSGASTYTGATTITGGTLRVTNTAGSATGTGVVTVANNATLEGDGAVDGNITVNSGGTIAPGISSGTSSGTLTAGADLTLNGTYACELSADTSDTIAVTGTLDIANADLVLSGNSSGVRIIATYGTLVGSEFGTLTNLPAGAFINYALNGNSIAIIQPIYVRATATAGANNGSSWDDAYLSLQDALANAATGAVIHVAAGTYFPAPDSTDRTLSFELINGVQILGGYPADSTGTTLADRDPQANPTVLSGDLDGNDIPGSPPHW